MTLSEAASIFRKNLPIFVDEDIGACATYLGCSVEADYGSNELRVDVRVRCGSDWYDYVREGVRKSIRCIRAQFNVPFAVNFRTNIVPNGH